ncbi:hypothetical protein M1D47_13120 [Bacillus sp. R1-10]
MEVAQPEGKSNSMINNTGNSSLSFREKGGKLFTWGMMEKCAMKDIRFLKQSRNTKRATRIKVALSIYYLCYLLSNVKKNG